MAARKVVRRVVPPKHVMSVEDLAADIERLDTLRASVRELGDEVAVVQKRVLEGLQSHGNKSMTVVDANGDKLTATWSQTPRHVIDEARLKKRLGVSMWRKVTTLVLDRRKLDAFIGSGEIDPVVVADCTDSGLSAPFVKVTRRK